MENSEMDIDQIFSSCTPLKESMDILDDSETVARSVAFGTVNPPIAPLDHNDDQPETDSIELVELNQSRESSPTRNRVVAESVVTGPIVVKPSRKFNSIFNPNSNLQPKQGRGRSRKRDVGEFFRGKQVVSEPKKDAPQHEAKPQRRHGEPSARNYSWLPLNWTVIEKTRENCASAGHVDKYYISPDGRKFRSKKAVDAYTLRQRPQSH